LILKGLKISSMGVNCYIVGCEETKEVAVMIRAAVPNRSSKCLEADNLKAIYIINTHGHIDHIGGNRESKKLLEPKS
jgi:glyoxylase-like metal-dependent hydrolase (beta-lactamase superfamily II)